VKYDSVLDLMHDSPLVALRGRACSPPRAHLWGKLELALPGSMKDRVAWNVITEAEKAGELRPGAIIAESSSGSMAEGLARVGTLKGYRVIIVTDPRIDPLTDRKLRALGAEVDVVDYFHPEGGWQQTRLARLREILDQNPGAFWPCQYDNPNNPGAYEKRMARELHRDLGDGIAAVVASVGSGGSLCGTARALGELVPDLRVVAVDAVGSSLFYQPKRKRLQSGHGNDIVAGNIDYTVIDEVHWISDAEAYNACRELAHREGIFGGGSAGACYVAASWVAQQFPPQSHVVTLLPDRGDRYHETIYNDAFFAEHGLTGGAAAAQPETLVYAQGVAERWSRAELPSGDGAEYFAPHIQRTAALTEKLGLR
jgi:cysteine synthase A